MTAVDRREYLKTYRRQWIRKRRNNYFLDKICVKCGSVDRLELDHIDPSLKESHAVWSWSEERRNKELLKCQVLCYACHKEKTKIDLAKSITHGSPGYARGCRCDICKQYQIKRMEKYHLDHPRKKNAGIAQQ